MATSLSDYEKIREDNIKDKAAMLKKLLAGINKYKKENGLVISDSKESTKSCGKFNPRGRDLAYNPANESDTDSSSDEDEDYESVVKVVNDKRGKKTFQSVSESRPKIKDMSQEQKREYGRIKKEERETKKQALGKAKIKMKDVGKIKKPKKSKDTKIKIKDMSQEQRREYGRIWREENEKKKRKQGLGKVKIKDMSAKQKKEYMRMKGKENGEKKRAKLNFSCSNCGKNFSRDDSAILCERGHKGIFNHSCLICDFKTNLKSCFERHVRSHLKSKSQLCF